MSLVTSQLFVATLTSQEDGISGILDALALKGNAVNVKAAGAAINDADELELADDSAGYLLTRDVVTETFEQEHARRTLMDRPEFVSPFKRNIDHAVAERVIEAEMEGDLYLDVTLDETVVAGTEICFKAGKPSIPQAAEKIVGHVVKQITPVDAVANTRRVLIHFNQ